MALQYVGGATATKAGATSGTSTISLTSLTGGISSSAAAGDIVIAAFATGSSADRTLSITDGTNNYTLIGSELYSNLTNDTNLRVAYKVLTGADASVTFGPTGNAADAGAMAVQVWRGVDPTNPLDVAAATATGTNTGRPNPASINPTTIGAIVIAVGAASAGTGAVFTSSDLSNFLTVTSADTYDAMLGVGSYAWSSGAFDPAQFGGGTTGTISDSWCAITLALRPAPDPVVLTGDNCSQANTSSTGAIGQTHTLTGAASAQTNTSTIGAVGQTHTLAGANSAQANTSTTGAVGQSHTLTVANSAQANASTTGSVGQTHILSGANCSQSNTGTDGAIVIVVGDVVLTGDDCTQANISTTGAVVKTHVLSGDDCDQANICATGKIGIDLLFRNPVMFLDSQDAEMALREAATEMHLAAIDMNCDLLNVPLSVALTGQALDFLLTPKIITIGTP